MTDQPDISAIPWYQSKVVQGVVVTLASQIFAHLHMASSFTSADLSMYVDDAFQVVAFLSAAWAGYHRVTKPTPQVVGTQARADQINSKVS